MISSRILRAAAKASYPAAFYRGGTSKGIIFIESDLPVDQTEREDLFRNAIGSPDPHLRQLNGMGGGISSLSKVLLVDKSKREDADVDYTFVQMSVKEGFADYASNCGNMLAAVGPFAVDHNLAEATPGSTTLRIFNTNTKKLIHSTFPTVSEGGAVRAQLKGDYAEDGVSGTGSRIGLTFVNPGGSRTGKLLPTGHVIDTICPETVPGFQGRAIQVNLIDCGNPCVFIRAQDLEMEATALPQDLDGRSDLLKRIEDIRRAACVLKGLSPSTDAAAGMISVPKICVVSPPSTHKLLSGKTLQSHKVDVVVRCFSSGDPHRALPITASLAVAAAADIPGSFVEQAVPTSRVDSPNLVDGHASGTINVGAEVHKEGETWHCSKAKVFRTARKLMTGQVFVD